MVEVNAPSVVCLGFFDGVHKGHLSLLRAAAQIAREQGLIVCAHTFDRAPGEKDFALSMLRELREEIGLSTTKSELKLVKIRRYDYKFTLLYMLKSNVPAEMLRLQKEEVDSVMWMSHEDIELLCKMGLFNRIHYQLLLDCEERLQNKR